ncbi:MAG TPA: hypothetical protein VMA36_08445 [Candidatus Limnocylindria bacterium]|nr:hypothetical protein [Candidatus Limnocylindria bacterium]
MTSRTRLPILVFGGGLILALLPPVHWAASGAGLVLGLPRSLFYLFASSVLLTAGVVGLWFADGAREDT